MKMASFALLGASLGLFCSSAIDAQESGNWRPASTTSKGVTGEIAFTETKIILNFSGYTVAQIRALEPAEIQSIFIGSSGQPGTGNLFRTEIPGDKRFLHKNTLCGAEEVQWIASFVSGHTLQLAMFSGATMPKFTPEAIANTPSLCGTYGYVR